MKQHLDLPSSPSRNYPCDQCDLEFNSEEQLEAHGKLSFLGITNLLYSNNELNLQPRATTSRRRAWNTAAPVVSKHLLNLTNYKNIYSIFMLIICTGKPHANYLTYQHFNINIFYQVLIVQGNI